jgi:hypothetical protein
LSYKNLPKQFGIVDQSVWYQPFRIASRLSHRPFEADCWFNISNPPVF